MKSFKKILTLNSYAHGSGGQLPVPLYLSCLTPCNHNLMIEYGRYGNTKIPKENRLCLVCESGQIENEIHLIFSCNCYNNLRGNMVHGF